MIFAFSRPEAETETEVDVEGDGRVAGAFVVVAVVVVGTTPVLGRAVAPRRVPARPPGGVVEAVGLGRRSEKEGRGDESDGLGLGLGLGLGVGVAREAAWMRRSAAAATEMGVGACLVFSWGLDEIERKECVAARGRRCFVDW